MMTDLPLPAEFTAPCALRRNKSDNARPPSASPPALRKLRRDIPSQNRSPPPLKNVNMVIRLVGKEEKRPLPHAQTVTLPEAFMQQTNLRPCFGMPRTEIVEMSMRVRRIRSATGPQLSERQRVETDHTLSSDLLPLFRAFRYAYSSTCLSCSN